MPLPPKSEKIVRLPSNSESAIRKRIHEHRSPELALITKYGKMFLEQYIPQKNTVSVEDFQKYMPLFNKALFKSLDEDAARKLSYEYAQRFSLQHPIHIVDSKELDPDGVIYPPDGRHHKVLLTLPPKIRSMEAVNKLGGDIVKVAAECLANTRSTGNPFDNRGDYYADQLARIVGLANKERRGQQDASFKKYADAILHKEESTPKPVDTKPQESSHNDDDPEGLDAEWE